MDSPSRTHSHRVIPLVLVRAIVFSLGLLIAMAAICKLAVPAPSAKFLPQRGRALMEMNPPPRAQQEVFYSWMWGDAGGHLLGHELAELDPLRWSDWLNARACIQDLRAWTTSDTASRPVEMMVGRNGGKRLSFKHVDDAMQYLTKHIADPAPQSFLPLSTAAPAPSPIAAPALGRSGPVTPAPHALGTSVNNSVGMDPLLALLAVTASILCACLGYAGFRSKQRKSTNQDNCGEEPLCSENDEDVDDNFGKHSSMPLDKMQLRQVLEDVEREEMQALPAPEIWKSQSSTTSTVDRTQALREVERILATHSVEEVLGGRKGADRKSEYRRLVRMLHPDKGLVSGERASLALRRVVDSQVQVQKRDEDEAAE